jgi:hypothetical protein
MQGNYLAIIFNISLNKSGEVDQCCQVFHCRAGSELSKNSVCQVQLECVSYLGRSDTSLQCDTSEQIGGWVTLQFSCLHLATREELGEARSAEDKIEIERTRKRSFVTIIKSQGP